MLQILECLNSNYLGNETQKEILKFMKESAEREEKTSQALLETIQQSVQLIATIADLLK